MRICPRCEQDCRSEDECSQGTQDLIAGLRARLAEVERELAHYKSCNLDFHDQCYYE